MQFEDQKRLWEKTISQAGDDPWAQLDRLATEDIRLCRSKRRKALALEKWAYSSRDAEAQRIVKSWFDWILERHTEIVVALRPDLSAEGANCLAVMVTSMLNGIWPFFGADRVRRPGLEHLETGLNDALHCLIKGYNSPSLDQAAVTKP